ncbi:MAG: cytochrome c biogenesis protein ResB [Armatimonadetes bacterium]|nr:cytochrome c biogenesis protein ResB [Armatimonadota bacterium]
MADELDTLRTAGDEGPESLVAALWRSLQSVRTTIWVLPILAAATTIGAVVPQKRPTDYYDMVYGATWGRAVTALGFDNVYNSTWFIILVCVLLANLGACVARSFRRAARGHRGPAPETLAGKLTAGRGSGCWQTTARGEEVTGRLAAALRRTRYAVSEPEGAGDARWLMVRRWPLAHYGSIVTHLSIFAIAVGAVIGRLPWTSLDRHVGLVEGQVTPDEADGKLGVDIRLDDFRMDYYEGTDQPSLYESDIVLLSNGQEVAKGTSTVNKQVVYEGLALGQTSWGLAGVRLTVKDARGKQESVELALGQAPGPHGESMWGFTDQGAVAMLGEEGKAALAGMQFVPDTKTGSTYPKSPAVALQLVTGLGAGGEHETHDLGLLPQGEERKGGAYTVRFDDVVFTSTLSARRDPGLPLVWIGFIVVSLGMAVMFYVRPRTFLIEVEESADREAAEVRVAVAGREFEESDRRIIESACEARLAPMPAAGKRVDRRRESS